MDAMVYCVNGDSLIILRMSIFLNVDVCWSMALVMVLCVYGFV